MSGACLVCGAAEPVNIAVEGLDRIKIKQLHWPSFTLSTVNTKKTKFF